MDRKAFAGVCLLWIGAITFAVHASASPAWVPQTPASNARASTTPARELGLTGFGVLVEGGVADVVVLDRSFRVVRTFIDGEQVFARE